MRYTGGGQSRDIVSFQRTKEGIPATVKSIEYDQIVLHLSHC
jgi:large subunit ribosomal protein L2